MSVSIVQRNSADIASGAGPFTISFGSNTVAGNAIFVIVRSGGTGTTSITDDKAGGSNTYNTDVSLLHSGIGTAWIFSAPNAGAAKVITLTLSVATTVRVIIYEVSGLTTAPIDKVSSLYNVSGLGNANSGNTATTTQADEWLLGVLISNNSNDTAPTAGTTQSYVLEDKVPASGGARLVAEDVTVSVTGAYQADFLTLDAGTSSDHVALIATYKIAAGAPPPVTAIDLCPGAGGTAIPSGTAVAY